MKRSELKRGKGPTRTAPKRDWSAARAKVEQEGSCRVCGEIYGLEAAHTIGREKQDVEYGKFPINGMVSKHRYLWVKPDSIIPLCPMHHREHDAHCLELLPFLSLAEQLNAVEAAGGIESARKRLCPSAYRAELR